MHRGNYSVKKEPIMMNRSDKACVRSEIAAIELLKQLGHLEHEVSMNERELIERYGHGPTPECVFQSEAVEVKRIPSTSLRADTCGWNPKSGRTTGVCDGRVVGVGRRGKLLWPWHTTVRKALEKATDEIVRELSLRVLHVVFVLPSTMNECAHRKIMRHVLDDVARYIGVTSVPRVHIHFMCGEDDLFDIGVNGCRRS